MATHAGDAVFVGIFGVSKANITSVTDNDSGKYTLESKRLANVSGGTLSFGEVWVATNVAATPYLGVTVIQNLAQKIIVAVADITGVNASYPVDANGPGTVGLSAVASDTVRTFQPRDLVLLMTGFAGQVTISAVGGDAVVNSTSVSLGVTRASGADLSGIQNASGTITMKAGSNVSRDWEAIAIAFASGSPRAPTALTVGLVTTTTIPLSWTQAPGFVSNNTVYVGSGSNCNGPVIGYTTGGPASGFTVGTLAPGRTYCFYVTAWNGSDESGPSTNVTATTPHVPLPPTGLVETGLAATTVSLSWSNPAGPLVNDTVFYDTACGLYSRAYPTPGVASAATITGLVSGTSYCFAVAAWNVSGMSGLSNTITATPGVVPAPPTILHTTGVTATSISLAWTQSTGLVLNNTIYAGTSCGTWNIGRLSTGGASTSLTVSGLTTGSAYCVAVSAWNGTGQSPLSSPLTVVTNHVPPPPTGISVGAVTTLTVSLTWVNPSGSVTNDTVFQGPSTANAICPSTGGYTLAHDVLTGSSFTVTGLATGMFYCFAVAAWNSTGMSPLDTLGTSIETAHVPSAPTGLAVTSLTLTTVSLAWANPPGSVANDTVYEASATFNSQCPTTGYSSGTNVGSVTTYLVHGLLTGNFYCFAVVAWNTTGASPPDALTTSVRTLHVPPPPTALDVTEFTSTTVSLSWVDPVGAISNVTVFWGATCDRYPNSQSVVGPAEAFTVTGLAPDTQYCLAVTATNGTGVSPLSNPVLVTTAVSPAPTLLGVSVAEGLALLIANGALWVLVGVEVFILWRQRSRQKPVGAAPSLHRGDREPAPRGGKTPRR